MVLDKGTRNRGLFSSSLDGKFSATEYMCTVMDNRAIISNLEKGPRSD